MELHFRSSVFLSVWKNTTNIFSYDNFRHISSLLWRFLRLMLRSLFFNIISSKIVDAVRSHLPKLHRYADDSKSKLYLFFFFNQSCTSGQDVAVKSMETCIREVKHWMYSDKLILNDDKTDFIIIASRHHLKEDLLSVPSG